MGGGIGGIRVKKAEKRSQEGKTDLNTQIKRSRIQIGGDTEVR